MASSFSPLQVGRLQGLRAQLLRRYEHRTLLEGVCFALLVAAFCLTLVFLYFWGQAKNDYNDFDWWVHLQYPGLLVPWSLVLLIGIVVSLTFSIVATAVLSDLWSKELTTLLLSFQVTAPFLHVGGVFLLTALSWPVALHFFRMNSRGEENIWGGLILGFYLSFLSVLYLVPLGLYSPCIKEVGTLGPPPALIGHRGAPMFCVTVFQLAPENTLMSFEKAVETGSEGLETDVTISVDGVPFLMHDQTLRRTTNVQHVFPNRTNMAASLFSWSDLQSLNAGAWFLSSDPFSNAGSLSAEERLRAAQQPVCSLQAFLQLAAQTEQLVIFDLYRPPRGHPFRDTWIHRTLEVLWLPSDLRSLVHLSDPSLQQTSGSRLPPEDLQRNNILRLNLHYSDMSTQSPRCPWLFSLAWCSGVQSVTTNNPQLLSSITAPLFLMSPEEYNLMWILTDLLSLLLIILFFIFHWWRERGLAFCSGTKVSLDNGTYSKFKTEMSDIWSVSSINSQAERTSNLATVTQH
ncbi:hypothetical protein F7725_006483 [Dissostichus mawsoni]|uniref:GP-PDE domain-containing protein n=1 Tax=Dissostichus mawsoni TaxID=36200 RepID=A0A7J5XUQ6_DISMA|nr:hypothetical protein F7725_006483 [Dissostichus mawsoni]